MTRNDEDRRRPKQSQPHGHLLCTLRNAHLVMAIGLRPDLQDEVARATPAMRLPPPPLTSLPAQVTKGPVCILLAADVFDPDGRDRLIEVRRIIGEAPGISLLTLTTMAPGSYREFLMAHGADACLTESEFRALLV